MELKYEEVFQGAQIGLDWHLPRKDEWSILESLKNEWLKRGDPYTSQHTDCLEPIEQARTGTSIFFLIPGKVHRQYILHHVTKLDVIPARLQVLQRSSIWPSSAKALKVASRGKKYLTGEDRGMTMHNSGAPRGSGAGAL